jgi:tellurium resistance protein TerZ
MNIGDPAPSPSEERVLTLDAMLKELVFGLYWDGPAEDAMPGDAADLDAWCLLLDAEGRILEAVHPARPRNDEGSVVHTGDSRTGAGAWDDERIFVFLAPLPRHVAALGFAVVSANGLPFERVRGASCHVSDPASDKALLQLDLTALGGATVHWAATLERHDAHWRVFTGHPHREGLAALHTLLPPPEKSA